MKSFKRVGKEYLTHGGNYMQMTLGILICIACFMLPFVIIQFFSALSEHVGMGVRLIGFINETAVIVFGFTITIPCVFGYFKMANSIAGGKNIPISEMFSVFRNAKRYFGTIAFSAVIFALLFMPYAIFSSAGDKILKALDFAGFVALYGHIKFVFYVVYYFAILAVFSRLFLMPYYLACGNKCFAAAKKSIKTTRAKPFILFGFILSFIPMILLSVLSLFTFFILYTIPVMVGTYSAMAKHLDIQKGKIYEK